MIAFKLTALVFLIKLLLEIEKPVVCASIYTLVVLVLSLAFGDPPLVLLVRWAAAFGLSLLYYWLLNGIGFSSIVGWLVFICGLPIAVF